MCCASEFDFGQNAPEGRFIDVAAHHHFTCGIRVGGDVTCWGAEIDSSCIDSTEQLCPGWGEDPLPTGPFISISASTAYEYGGTVCGVREEGGVECWNDGTPNLRPPVGRFATVDVADNSHVACATRLDGEAVCWGTVDWLDEIPAGEFAAVTGSRSHGWCMVERVVPGRHAREHQRAEWTGLRYSPRGPSGVLESRLATRRRRAPSGTGEGRAVAATWHPSERCDGPASSQRSRMNNTANATKRHTCGLRPDGTAECWTPHWPPGADPAASWMGATAGATW